nr:hypothetical protein [Leptolyngbyaceae cyanobacterium MO_188.B28]
SNANKSNANKSNANKKDISSHIEVLESLYEGSLPLSEGNHTAETPQILATQVLAADSCVQSKVLNHKPALVAAKNTPSRTPSKTFKTFSTPRSAFLARLNLELTQHIGSKADYLINKLLSERPNIEPQQMIEAIAAEIPHMDESENILASLNRLNYYYSAN